LRVGLTKSPYFSWVGIIARSEIEKWGEKGKCIREKGTYRQKQGE